MITKFKPYNKLGINSQVINITEKIFIEFIKHYDKKRCFTNYIDSFDVDLTDSNLNNNFIKIIINYNESYCFLDYTENNINIGTISRIGKTSKTNEEIHSDIVHEIKHLIYFNVNKIFKKKFIKDFKYIFNKDFIGSLTKSDLSINNFLKNANFSEKYKKLLIYLYLAHKDELEARLHEYYIRIKYSNFNDTIAKFSNYKNSDINFYNDMIIFEFNVDDFSEIEYNKIITYICDKKDFNRIKKYIQSQGKKFIKKLNNLNQL